MLACLFHSRRRKDGSIIQAKPLFDDNVTVSSQVTIIDSSPAELVAENFLHALNEHDLDALRAQATPDCGFLFENAGMTLDGFVDEVKNLFECFPDFGFKWKGLLEVDPDVVDIPFFQASGTHTGKPYGYGPYPEVPAKGRTVRNDTEHVVIKVVGEKVAEVKFEPTKGSELTGPAGIYLQIGGFPM